MAKQNPNNSNETEVQFISIAGLTREVLDRFSDTIQSKRLHVDQDLDDVSAAVYPRFIHSAVSQLLENAIDSTPEGGDVNVTLIDGGTCWELEVADSAGVKPPLSDRPQFTQHQQGKLPRLEPLDIRSRLELARRAALVHGGQIQTLDCPQGGSATVLVIPRRQEVSKSA